MAGSTFGGRALRAAALTLGLLLGACGGGGGGGGSSSGSGSGGGSTNPPELTFTPGVFNASGTYKDRCVTVRTGLDSEGNPFHDQAGTVLHENFWLRSWIHETYLWNTEVSDQSPAGFSDPLAYFAVLKTTATTPSGKPKDQFHFTQNTAAYLASTHSAPEASYGAEFVVRRATVPRDVRVQFTDPGTPASSTSGGVPALVRGSVVLKVDGVDLVNDGTTAGVTTLNAGLFPATAGESHTFEVKDPGAAASRTVTLTSVTLTPKAVNRTAVLTTTSGKVGYMLLNTFNTFNSEKEIADALTSLKTQGATDLVVDLRYNGGGLLAVASQLAYQIAGAAQTTGKKFESLQFNTGAGSTNPVTGGANTPTPFYTSGLGFSLASGTALPTLNLSRVYVLTTGSTCSASEAVINGLRGADVDVVLIGDTTCGKPYGFYPQDNCGNTYFAIQFKGVNNKGFGDYADGFAPTNSPATFAVKTPGCYVLDDFNHDLGDASEGLLAAALQFRADGSCPALPAAQVTATAPETGAAIKTTGRSAIGEFLRTNRNMAMP